METFKNICFVHNVQHNVRPPKFSSLFHQETLFRHQTPDACLVEEVKKEVDIKMKEEPAESEMEAEEKKGRNQTKKKYNSLIIN